MSFVPGASAADSDKIYALDIPNEPLSRALEQFGLETSQQIIFSADVVRGHDAPALRGRYTSDAALAALLSNTDLTISASDTGVLMI